MHSGGQSKKRLGKLDPTRMHPARKYKMERVGPEKIGSIGVAIRGIVEYLTID